MPETRIHPMTMDDYPAALALWKNHSRHRPVLSRRGRDHARLPAAQSGHEPMRLGGRNPHRHGPGRTRRPQGVSAPPLRAGRFQRPGHRTHAHHPRPRRPRAHGLEKAHAFLFSDNETGREFWKRIGWTWRTDIGVVSVTMEEALK